MNTHMKTKFASLALTSLALSSPAVAQDAGISSTVMLLISAGSNDGKPTAQKPAAPSAANKPAAPSAAPNSNAAQPASRAFPELIIDVKYNSYTSILTDRFAGFDGKFFDGKFYELVNCTTGLITTSSNSRGAPGGSTISVAQLTPTAQNRVRTNCNSNGLRAGF